MCGQTLKTWAICLRGACGRIYNVFLAKTDAVSISLDHSRLETLRPRPGEGGPPVGRDGRYVQGCHKTCTVASGSIRPRRVRLQSL